jgi:hypothetical protein
MPSARTSAVSAPPAAAIMAGVQFSLAIGQSLQLVEHGGHISRHADLIGLGMGGAEQVHLRALRGASIELALQRFDCSLERLP